LLKKPIKIKFYLTVIIIIAKLIYNIKQQLNVNVPGYSLLSSYAQLISNAKNKFVIMNRFIYSALGGWLSTADFNYLEGRVLWRNLLLAGSCILLWLSIEQIIKLLILQKDPELLNHESENQNSLYTIIDTKAKSISPKHRASELLENFTPVYPEIDLSPYQDTLDKLEEWFQRRYVRHEFASIPLDMIHSVDELYFLLREEVNGSIPISIIDTIFIYKKHGWQLPIPAYKMAYIDNKSFRSREHPEVNLLGPDGNTYIENGSSEITIRRVD
jgi:hypothetical protein